MGKSFMKFITVFDIKVHPASLSEFVTVIREQLQLRKHIVQFGVNSATVNEASKNVEFRRVINSADLLNIDGMSVVWALRCLGHTVPERVATPDLADSVMKMAEENNFSVFLFGAADPVISLCVENLKIKYPLLKV
jgi:N-acetylglucosaminyldiphosphoundecaprenol N-acetyl-beta-D-mannosaminyltransferase